MEVELAAHPRGIMTPALHALQAKHAPTLTPSPQHCTGGYVHSGWIRRHPKTLLGVRRVQPRTHCIFTLPSRITSRKSRVHTCCMKRVGSKGRHGSRGGGHRIEEHVGGGGNMEHQATTRQGGCASELNGVNVCEPASRCGHATAPGTGNARKSALPPPHRNTHAHPVLRLTASP